MNAFNRDRNPGPKLPRRGAKTAILPRQARIAGLMQLFASSLLCYGLTRFEGHPVFFLGALAFSIVLVVIGAWNLAEHQS